MEEDKIIDQSELAQDVSSKIEYEFIDMFLIKPLDVVRVTKEFTKPVVENPAKKESSASQKIGDNIYYVIYTTKKEENVCIEE